MPDHYFDLNDEGKTVEDGTGPTPTATTNNNHGATTHHDDATFKGDAIFHGIAKVNELRNYSGDTINIVTTNLQHNGVAIGGGGGADNLGNHTATQNLDLDSNDIRNITWCETGTTTCSQHVESDSYKGRTNTGTTIVMGATDITLNQNLKVDSISKNVHGTDININNNLELNNQTIKDVNTIQCDRYKGHTYSGNWLDLTTDNKIQFHTTNTTETSLFVNATEITNTGGGFSNPATTTLNMDGYSIDACNQLQVGSIHKLPAGTAIGINDLVNCNSNEVKGITKIDYDERRLDNVNGQTHLDLGHNHDNTQPLITNSFKTLYNDNTDTDITFTRTAIGKRAIVNMGGSDVYRLRKQTNLSQDGAMVFYGFGDLTTHSGSYGSRRILGIRCGGSGEHAATNGDNDDSIELYPNYKREKGVGTTTDIFGNSLPTNFLNGTYKFWANNVDGGPKTNSNAATGSISGGPSNEGHPVCSYNPNEGYFRMWARNIQTPDLIHIYDGRTSNPIGQTKYSLAIGCDGVHRGHSFTLYHYCKNHTDHIGLTDSEINDALLGKIFKATDTCSVLEDGAEITSYSNISANIYDNALSVCTLNNVEQIKDSIGILTEIIDKGQTNDKFIAGDGGHIRQQFNKPQTHTLYKLGSKGDGMVWLTMRVGSGDILNRGDLLISSDIEEEIMLSTATYNFNGALMANGQTLSTVTGGDGLDYYQWSTSTTIGWKKESDGSLGSRYGDILTTPVLQITFTSFNTATNVYSGDQGGGLYQITITGWTCPTCKNFGGFLKKQSDDIIRNSTICKYMGPTLTEGNGGQEGNFTNSQFTLSNYEIAFGADDDDTMVNLGDVFGGETFQYFGSSYASTDFNIASNGYIGLGTTQTSVSATINDFDDYRRIGLLSLDLRLRSTLGSQVRYRLENADGINNCIFVLQYYKIGEYTSATNENTLEIKFWLNNSLVSNRGKIEMRFITLQSTNHSIVVGLSNGSNTNPSSQDLSAGLSNTSTPMEEFSSGTIDLAGGTLTYTPNGANYDVSYSATALNSIDSYKKYKIPIHFV